MPITLRRRLSRRGLLRSGAAAAVAMTALALVGCTNDDESEAQAATGAASPSRQPRQAAPDESPTDGTARAQTDSVGPPDRSPRRFGVIRYFIARDRVDTWDPLRSRSRFVQRVHALTYNRLLRPTAPNSPSLKADLCDAYEMVDEESVYVHLARDAQFVDQPFTPDRPVQPDDVRLSIERRASEADASIGPALPRFDFSQPDDRYYGFWLRFDAQNHGTFRNALASPYAWITSVEAIEHADLLWADGSPAHPVTVGTGPYRLAHVDELRELSLVRTPNWWGDRVGERSWRRLSPAWPDAITLLSGSRAVLLDGYEAGAIDSADEPLSHKTIVELRRLRLHDLPYERPVARPVQLLTPYDPEPGGALHDPRVAQAMSASINRPRLVTELYGDGRAHPSGPIPWYFDRLSLDPTDLAGYPGYSKKPTISELRATQLIGAAGGADLLSPVRLVATLELVRELPAAAILVRDMISRATGLRIDLDIRGDAEARAELRGGARFALLGWGDVPLSPDPSVAWRQAIDSPSPDGWGVFPDPEFDSLLAELAREIAWEEGVDSMLRIQKRLLSGESTAFRHNLINGVHLGVAQPWLEADPRLFSHAWAELHLADSHIVEYPHPGHRRWNYPSDRRRIPTPGRRG